MRASHLPSSGTWGATVAAGERGCDLSGQFYGALVMPSQMSSQPPPQELILLRSKRLFANSYPLNV